MKGIILAGGSGTRLHPLTKVTSKQLLPIYDKPMIYYPLSTLMLSGIKEILIISTPDDLQRYKDLLGDGSHLGIKFVYKEQLLPNGIAQAFIIGEEFIGSDNICLILGDNVFYGGQLPNRLRKCVKEVVDKNIAIVLGYYVNDPERYGVVNFDNNGNVTSIKEKPKVPESNYAVSGLYYYPNDVIDIAKNQEPSKRGELEITDVNKTYLSQNRLMVEKMGRGYAWLDTGTHDSLIEASQFVQTLEKRQGMKVSCLEEIALKKKWISSKQLIDYLKTKGSSEYYDYLRQLLN